MKWYQFDQNNSGGSFIVDSNVCHRLFIQAEDADSANQKAEDLGCYWNGVDDDRDCECCGDRWYSQSIESWGYDASESLTIEEYVQNLADKWGWTSPDARLFYADGRVLDIYSSKIARRDIGQI